MATYPETTTDGLTALADMLNSDSGRNLQLVNLAPLGQTSLWATRPYEIPETSTPAEQTLQACCDEPLNDTGNGQRLLKNFGDSLLHVRDVGWFMWTGTRWTQDGGGEKIMRLAQTTASRIALEAAVIAPTPQETIRIEEGATARLTLDALKKVKGPDAKYDQKWPSAVRAASMGDEAEHAVSKRKMARERFAINSGNSGRIRGMIEQALPHRSIKVDQLDAEKLAFNVANGTLRFISEEISAPKSSGDYASVTKNYRVERHDHRSGDKISKVAPVEYDPNAKCPFFDEAIARFQPDDSVRKFVQRYHGYALTGLTGEQCFLFNYGTGSNWKSTFVEIISRIMGPYSATIAFESLAGDQQRSGSQATPDLARLPGARLVRASEPERGVQFKESLIKSLTGGEPMLVRSLNKEFFEFHPSFKLVLSGNHKPQISGVDHGIWRRVNFVPWPVTISQEEKRPMDDVMADLWAERSGILNWLIEGALDYLNFGLQTPKAVIDATAEYREQMDPVGIFVTQCIREASVTTSAGYVFARQMYGAYVSWANANAIRPWGEKAFAGAMEQKGFKKEKNRRGIRYLNVELHDVPADDHPSSEGAHDDDVVPL